MIQPLDRRGRRGSSPWPCRAVDRQSAVGRSAALGLVLRRGIARGGRRPPVEVENVRVGFGAGERIQDRHVDAGLGPAQGGLRAVLGVHGAGRPRRRRHPDPYRQAVDVAAGRARRFTAYSRPGGRDTEFTIRLFDTGGRRVVEAPQASTMPDAARTDHARRDR